MSPRSTPPSAPHDQPNTFGTPPHLNRAKYFEGSSSLDAKENSPQRPVMRPHTSSAGTPGGQPPLSKSNRDNRQGVNGFNLHRPRPSDSSRAADRPVMAAQKPQASRRSPQAQAGPSSQQPRAFQPFAATRPRPSRPDIPQAPPPFRIRPSPWLRDAEAKFRLVGLPPQWETSDIHAELIPYGNVTYIDIAQDHRRSAYVTFTPPPSDHVALQKGLVVCDNASKRRHEISFQWMQPSRITTLRASEVSVEAKKIDFGVMKSESIMLGLHSVQATPSEGVDVSINTNFKRIELGFSVPSSLMAQKRGLERLPEQSRYKMRINFAQISSIAQMQDPQTGTTSFVVTTDAPPLVYKKTDEPLKSHNQGSKTWKDWMLWYRQTEIEQDLTVAKQAVKQLQRDNPIVDLGRWLTYRLTFDTKTTSSKDFRELQEVLETHSISLTKDRIIKSQFAATKAMAMWSWLDSPVAVLGKSDKFSSLLDLQQMAHQTIRLPFEVRYQLESCISHGCIHECNVDQAFLEKLSAMAADSDHSKLRAVKLLEKVVDERRRFYDPNDIFRKVVPNMSGACKQRQHAVRFVKVLTATVTPTTIYFNAPSLEPSNRVIRHFRQHEDRFLRVRFAEEKYKGKIHSSEELQDQEIYTRVKRTMMNGIKVGDRVYEFLAFGNSQFREHGAYFFAATGDLNAAKIRQWMGNFDHIKVVAKYCARLGQCLSTTRSTQNRAFAEVKIPDIERNGFCFSDGVGKISPMLAVLIASEIGMLRPHAGTGKSGGTSYPSAFQFRMGGCKGILVVDPSMGSQRSVAIRPSQEKFSMIKHAGLEICRISQFTNASLNVQIILVLSALGVPDRTFTDMMDVMLSDIELAMKDENKATELLQKNIDLNGGTVQLAQMILDGFMERQDPFTVSCLRLWRSWSLKYLKEKQRMYVDEGAFVLGCIDETNSLEGHRDDDPDALPEIFLQIPDREQKGRYKIVEGVCMLARNPSLHPGDVRIVRAVSCEPLRHIRDCVVLPQKGDRDIANMCSGGDLDGDDYMVIWDEALLPKEWNYPPMCYQAPAPVEAQGEITVDDMTSFFVTHMKYNNVGKIATLHKCLADYEYDGVKSAKCLRLAALHSQAVDYAKTGVPADLPKDLQMSSRPHWHETAKRKYTSRKIIGQLYDKVKRADFVPAWDAPFDSRILEAYQLDTEILEQTRELKEQYDEAVRRIMAKYDIKSEFEVWSTFVLDHGEDYNDYKFSEKIGEEVCTLKERFQKLCHERIADDEREQRKWDKKGPFVAAMYTVTAREVKAALAECTETKVVGGLEVPVREKTTATMPLMSFPWLFQTELGWVANKRTGYAQGSTVLGRTNKANQQATKIAKTKLRHDMLGDVPEPAPLQELVLDDVDTDTEELLDVTYTGPRLVDEVALRSSLPNGSAEDESVKPSQSVDSLLDTRLVDPAFDESLDGMTAQSSLPQFSPIADVYGDEARTPSPLAMAPPNPRHLPSEPTPPATTPAAEEDVGEQSSSGEEEEVILATSVGKKSALDKLEDLLQS